jgi:3-hydroxybutyryl-CoA dehydrogenase
MVKLDKSSIIGVIGSGTMGIGIAQVAATYGHEVILIDSSIDALNNSKLEVEKTFSKLVAKNKFSQQEVLDILNKINFTSDFDALHNCDLVIEAVVENLNIKQQLFKNLEEKVNPNTLIATNTSSLSVTSIAAICGNPERVLGTHFFNPAPIMPLVEIVPSILTSSEVVQNVKTLISEWGKTTVIVKDTPGFIVNRVARPFYGEALRILEEGIANITTIDWAMKEFGNFKMGPFELMDFIGNDINYKVTETVFEQFYFDPRFKPSITQKRMVEANLLGRKNGKGFYDYSENSIESESIIDESIGKEVFFRILAMLVNEAADAVFMNIASKVDIDLAMTKGTNYPKGLLRWADEIGLNKIVGTLNNLYETYREDRYRVNPLLRKMEKKNSSFYS